MTTPKMPWYSAMENALKPYEPHADIFLLFMAALCIAVVIWGTPATKWLFFIYLVSP